LSDKKKSDNYYNKNDNHTFLNKKEKRQSMTDKHLAILLIVDDDPDIVQVLKLGLQKNRFLVNAFTNPEEALQSFKSYAKSYCVVVSDMRMPALSGIPAS
jgi:ActR/RegA family two-component response regulator